MPIYEVMYQLSTGGLSGGLSMLVECEFGGQAADQVKTFLKKSYKYVASAKTKDGRLLPFLQPGIQDEGADIDILEVVEAEII
jgi:hypothetical protein